MIRRAMICILLFGLLTGCTKEETTKKANHIQNNVQDFKDHETPQRLPDYWPTKKWRTSLPEQQGVNSAKLADLFERLEKENQFIDSLIIVKNGYIVAEKYYGIYSKDTMHEINSVTKSMMSAVTGAAIADGHITGVDEKVLDYFPGRKIQNMDTNKQNWTIHQFLSMSAGLDWREIGENKSPDFWSEFEYTEDTVKFVLDKPINRIQLKKFNYNTGLPHVLSAIVQNQTGMKTSEYARKKLFEPIGITKFDWPEAQGVSKGGYRMSMSPRNMARFGYLYLQHGKWDGKQIIPEEWVKKSTSPQVPTRMAGAENYGYYFWLHKTKDGYDEISAMGDRGQYIIIVPQLDLVVVQTARAFGDINIYEDYIYPAMESSNPIPVDKKSNERLKKLLNLK
jgi:CubicO group peptidase (beta-lactamase class C family)